MYTKEEKILILGALFHDTGKFVQRCLSKYKTHQEIGFDIVEQHKEIFMNILGNKEDYERMCGLITKHHNRGENDNLIKILREADHITASQRVELDYNEEPGEKWSHIYLSSLFSKIRLNAKESLTDLKYYKQEVLTNKNYKAMIPRFDSEEEAKTHKYKYKESNFNDFISELKSVLSFYEGEDDFDSLINLILVLYEKYFWCIPDFTGNDETDISLYNHIKDVTAVALCLLKNDKGTQNINLIVGDIPGIQKYIFGVENRKAAKMLRGRSIFVQILSRNFATLFLKKLGLTEANLIMLAGGKFYILAPDQTKFETIFTETTVSIQKYLAENFVYELNFAAGFASFSSEEMKTGKLQFGRIVEAATARLNEQKQKMHNKYLLSEVGDYEQYILDDYIDTEDVITDNVKCFLTSKPIIKGKEEKKRFKANDGKYEEKNVYKQAYKEYLVGEKVIKDNVVISLEDNLLDFDTDNINNLEKLTNITEGNKLIINPDIDEILKEKNKKPGIANLLRNSRFFTAANFVSFDRKNEIMDFEEISESTEGASYLTLLKGDIDELGLIMSYGLERDIDKSGKNEDLNSISRITTLSHHLKYFFSFFVNGFLNDLNEKENIRSYTVFAGGDDIMIVCHQNHALKVLNEFNRTFMEFTCNNPEVHTSYSLTHFKHSTPIRLVAEFSEENQKEAKTGKNRSSAKKAGEMANDQTTFMYTNRKNSTYIYETIVKNEELDNLIKYTNKLYEWTKDEKIPVSNSILRNLFIFAEMMKEYNESKGKDTAKLLWHPQLTYMINRNLKDSNGEYKKKLIEEKTDEFFEELLSLNKKEEYKNLDELLYPACCGAIYKLR